MATSYTATRDNIRTYYQSLDMPGGYSFNQPETIKQIDLYYNGKFKSGQFDSRGFRKYFYNISKPACDIATKFIDLDTKDIVLIPEGNEEKVFIMQRDLKQYLKEKNFGVLLNTIGHNYPKYGHVFLKNTKNGWKLVNIHNLRFDPGSESFDTDVFFYEVHLMTLRDIQDLKGDKEAVESLTQANQALYLVYECYDYEEGGWKRSFKANVWDYTKDGETVRSVEELINNETDFVDGICIKEEPIAKKDFPYRELVWEKVPGRRMGMGYVEYLFDNQIRMNELVNIKARGLHYTSLHLFQTRDDGVGRNILTDVENGDIIKTTDEIRPVQTEERNLAPFQQEEARWDTNADRKTFSFDIARGESLPSRTPLGVASLSAGMVTSYFELKRENFGLFIKALLLDDILPSFENISHKQHMLTFMGSDAEIERFDSMMANLLINASLQKYILETGFFPNPEEREQQKQNILQSLKQRKHRYLNLPEGFYENVKYAVDVLITGEQVDSGSKIQTLQTALQLIGTNPAILQDKNTRSVFFKLLEMAGVNPVEMNLTNDAPAAPMPQGGSVAAMGQPTPQQVPSQQTL